MIENREILTERMADNLPVLRKKLSLSQEELAHLVGVSRFTIMEIETKKRKMMWTTFLSLVLLFDKNEGTAVLLRALDIYTDELEQLIMQGPENELIK